MPNREWLKAQDGTTNIIGDLLVFVTEQYESHRDLLETFDLVRELQSEATVAARCPVLKYRTNLKIKVKSFQFSE